MKRIHRKKLTSILKDCTQCGECCRSETCYIGSEMFPEDHGETCPALIFVEEKYWCAFVKNGTLLHPDVPYLVSKLLGIGKGCCGEEGLLGSWDDVVEAAWGVKLPDEQTNILLMECTGFPIGSPVAVYTQLVELRRQSDGDFSRALHIANEGFEREGQALLKELKK